MGRGLADEVRDQDRLAETRAQQHVQTDVGRLRGLGASSELPHGSADLKHDGLVDAGGAEASAVDLAQCGLVCSGELANVAEEGVRVRPGQCAGASGFVH